jgi:DNA-binding NtrC family response regulator
LFQAVSGITVSLPALREHREDIPEIAKQFLRQLIETKLAKPKGFSMAALNALRTHDWPGNLAELQNAVRTLALTALHEEIGVEEVKRILTQFDPLAPISAGAGVSLDLPLREARDIFEKQYFEHHIEKAAGNMSRVADAVGLERTHLYRKLKQLEIKLSRKSE